MFSSSILCSCNLSQHRFSQALEDANLALAAAAHPKFKLSWMTEEWKAATLRLLEEECRALETFCNENAATRSTAQSRDKKNGPPQKRKKCLDADDQQEGIPDIDQPCGVELTKDSGSSNKSGIDQAAVESSMSTNDPLHVSHTDVVDKHRLMLTCPACMPQKELSGSERSEI